MIGDRVSTPSEALAAHILDRLVTEGLLRAEDVKRALAKVAAGTITAAEWRALVERATPGRAP